jgi:VRR-NUC domain
MADTFSASMTEDELLQAIYDAALYRGWRIHHDRRSDKAIQQGHSGFPDLVCARNGKVLYFELKSATGKVSPDQTAWLTDLGPDAMTVWPKDLDAVLRLLA